VEEQRMNSTELTNLLTSSLTRSLIAAEQHLRTTNKCTTVRGQRLSAKEPL
jgi:hypothetical protein